MGGWGVVRSNTIMKVEKGEGSVQKMHSSGEGGSLT